MRPAASKLPTCRYFRFPLRSCAVTKVPCALKVTKVLLVIVFLPTCALEDTRVSQFVCFPPVLCPRSCQSFAVSRYLGGATRISLLSCASEVAEVILLRKTFQIRCFPDPRCVWKQ